MTNPIIVLLGWIWTVACWIAVVLTSVCYGSPPAYLLLGAMALTGLMTWTSPRVKRWLR